MQKIIMDVNPRAFVIPCAAHSLHLSVYNVAKALLEITDFSVSFKGCVFFQHQHIAGRF